jgi:polyribonucleotide nucleotidyltransferase
MKKVFEMTLAGRPLVVETGKIAQFANGAVLIKYGDTVILSTVTASTTPREGVDYFPLSVDYEEKLYAVGKIPGGFIKREGRPSEKAILTSRVIDRPIRPLFPKDLKNDVSVNNLVLSVDQDCSPEITSMIGTSIAIAISDVPWNGPIGGVILGLVDGKVVINPNQEERAVSKMYVTLVGTGDKIAMIEAGADEVSEQIILDAIIAGHEVIKDIVEFIRSIQQEIGKPKFTYISSDVPQEVFEEVREFAYEKMRLAVLSQDKSVRDQAVSALSEETRAHLSSKDESWEKYLADAIYKLEKKVVREYLIKEHKRVDSRGIDEIRPLGADVGILPRVHGSGYFSRGQTQVLTICTLASLAKVQMLDGLDNEEEKRYMHHYNFPSYSVGEAKPNRSPGRREIGHGALAERSLVPVLPTEEEFPYAIRLVSEITMSNGSTSQGAVCASTLALMDAGVPIKRPVAGISAGLIVNEDQQDDFLVFMDIQGIEDFFGDMDFKVAGTTEGITAIQMDLKVDGLTYDIIRQAFELTRKGRLQIIREVILPCIETPRKDLSVYAPKILQTVIPIDKIREVIGAGGKVINKIIADTKTEIDIDSDTGHVYVSAVDINEGQRAIKMIEGIANDPEVGAVFQGKVTRLMSFGAFVEFLPGKEGLVHISKMSWKRVEKVEDILKEGDVVQVMVTEIDSQGRINLSMRDCMDKPDGFDDSSPEKFQGSDRPRSGSVKPRSREEDRSGSRGNGFGSRKPEGEKRRGGFRN